MKKQIFIGAESFERLREEDYFYVDKTLFIKELLESKGTVTLITRPRRFGKTLNMSMLKSFFDVRADSKDMFDGLEIANHRDICEKHQNQYPVISLTLKNAELDTFDKSIARIKNLVSAIYEQNRYLYESDKLSQRQKEVFHLFFMRKSTEEELQYSLL